MKRVISSLRVIFIAAVVLALVPFTALADSGAAHRLDQPFPVQLGTSGGNINDISKGFCYGGTLGALVQYNGTQYILSNNHVLARTNAAKKGEEIIQPGLIDQNPACAKDRNDAVAQLYDFVPIRFKTKGSLPANSVDAAIAQVLTAKVDPSGAILDIGVISSEVAAPVLNGGVQKSGRTTGHTTGTISGINATVDVSYGSGNTARFTNQIIITPGSFLAGGDSGSLLVDDGAIPRAVGLLFAGSSSIAIANPIQEVLNSFGVSMVGVSSQSSVPTGTWERAVAWLKGIGRVRESHAQSLPDQANAAAVAAVTRVKERHEAKLMSIPGVVGVAVGLSERDRRTPVIDIYVQEATAALNRALPRSLENVEVNIVETGEIVAY